MSLPQEKRDFSVLDIDVFEPGRMRWQLEHCLGSSRRTVKKGTENLILNERRRKTIGMLSDLLRHAEDRMRRDALSPDLYRDMLIVVGHELFDLLFVGDPLRMAVRDEIDALRDRETGLLRIKLEFEADREGWLASLPWEYACTPVGDSRFWRRSVFLAETAELVLSRRLFVENARSLEKERWPVPVLLVSSSPRTDPKEPKLTDPDSDQPKELTRVNSAPIVAKLKELELRNFISLTILAEDPPEHPSRDYEWRVTRAAVEKAIEDSDPVIVHFLGHGRSMDGVGSLALTSDNGDVDWISDEHFAALVRKSPRFTLAFLQACESALPAPYVSFSGVARHLVDAGLPAVVAMQYQVAAHTANEFAAAFYDALLEEQLSVDHAVERGRERILGDANSDERMKFGLPVVYLQSEQSLTDPLASKPMLHRTTALQRHDTEVPIICARCTTENAPWSMYCRMCTLQLRCEKCETPYLDALRDNICSQCREPIKRDPQGRDEVERAPGTVTGEATKPARATLRALHGEASA